MKDKKENILNINKNTSIENIENLQGILANIFTVFTKEMKPKIVTCFETLDDSLFDLAEKSDTNSKQSKYFDSMKHIRKSRKIILKVFFSSIKEVFTSFKRNELDYKFHNKDKTNTIDHNDAKGFSLSLIDENELDETLAVSNLISKSEMAYGNHIFAFEKRFSVLASKSVIKSNQLPVGPYVIVNSFNQSLKTIDLDVDVKLIFYKIFERTVIGKLNGTFNKINELFISKGVIPQISFNQANMTNTNSLPVLKDSDDDQVTNNPETETPIANQGINDKNYQLISELFSKNFNNNNNNNNNYPQQNSNSGGVTNDTNIGLNTVLNALSILQSQMNSNSEAKSDSIISPIDMKDSIINQLRKLDENTTNQKVKRTDEDTINLVGMLFQFIVEDRNLPESIQVLLARLQIPYLKIALENKNLFADKTHPARILLNNLSQASVGWTKESDTKMQFFSKIEEITHKILEVDKYENSFFNVLNTDFIIFQKKLRKISDIRQKRTTEKNIGQEKIDLAKEASAKLLLQEMSNKEMPLLIKDILLGEWSNVLNLTNLRFTVNSEEYLEKIDFVKQVIYFSNTDLNQIPTIDTLVVLANTYATGLKFVAFDSITINTKQKELFNCLANIHGLNENQPDQKVEILTSNEVMDITEIKKYKNEVVNYMEDMINPEPEVDNLEDINEKYINVVKSLKIGIWLEIDRDNKTPMRAKLSWISPITGKYLFVNSRGLKITDKKVANIALGLQNKTIRILKQEKLFDRALTSIANQLKKEK